MVEQYYNIYRLYLQRINDFFLEFVTRKQQKYDEYKKIVFNL